MPSEETPRRPRGLRDDLAERLGTSLRGGPEDARQCPVRKIHAPDHQGCSGRPLKIPKDLLERFLDPALRLRMASSHRSEPFEVEAFSEKSPKTSPSL
jgi:hypothetical protein